MHVVDPHKVVGRLVDRLLHRHADLARSDIECHHNLDVANRVAAKHGEQEAAIVG